MAAFKQVFGKWRVTKLTMEEDTEPYAKKLEDSVVALAGKYGIRVVTKVSHTLYSIPNVIKSNDSLQPFTFKRYIATVKKIGQPDNPLPPLDAVSFHGCFSPVVPGYEMPCVEEFGMTEEEFVEGSHVWKGGEDEALRRFDALVKSIESGLEEVDNVGDVCFPKVTALSPYMRFGCISARLIYHTLTKLQKKMTNKQYVLNVLMKLMFRDFLFTLGHRNFFFDKMKQNPVCLQIPWESNGDFLQRWREAKTGFPWIDAVQTQLRKEGWANHLGRLAAACFLTRGCLWVSWEEGFMACQEMQIDFEWSLCAANWLMISCSSFFVKSNKYYCPVNTGKHHDPQGIFIRKYIPQLRNFPEKYIYDPWNAPLEVQQAAGCIIGKDYPMRIIDHEAAKLVCAKRLREMVGELQEGISTSVSLGGDNEDEFVRKKKKNFHVGEITAIPVR
ncbi:cryptochrome-1-like isoform X2 [Paramuricea clavata]|nr:cryptochrome-1-like isoform X2 [Paramuricea clavata]